MQYQQSDDAAPAAACVAHQMAGISMPFAALFVCAADAI